MNRLQKIPSPLKLVLAALAGSCLFSACLEFGARENYLETTGMISSEEGLITGEFIPNPDPPQSGSNSLEFVLAEDDGAPITGATVTVTPFMPSMGHGSTQDPVVEELGNGTYLATDIVYTMNGQWRLTIDVETDSGTETFILFYEVE